MAKAFDKVHWIYLERMLRKFSFPEVTIQLIMKRVTITSIAIIFNNSRTPYFKLSRGLCQGDPLSPFLFVICMEGLSININHALNERWWISYSLKKFRNPPFHLAFAVDFIFFIKVTTKGIQGVKKVISIFC